MTAPDLSSPDPVVRAATAAALGHADEWPADARERLVRLAGADGDPRVRSAALGALVRRSADHEAEVTAIWRDALGDPDRAVVRRALELAPGLPTDQRSDAVEAVLPFLGHDDPLVAEAAAFALGEIGAGRADAVAGLAAAVTSGVDPLVREAAVAALGSLGDERGLPAVLAAVGDRPAVRRRAVLALAAFDGPEVEVALRRALDDRDWQVRQAAEDLLGPEPQA